MKKRQGKNQHWKNQGTTQQPRGRNMWVFRKPSFLWSGSITRWHSEVYLLRERLHWNVLPNTETTSSKRHVWLKTSVLSLLMERYNWNKVTNITHKSKHKGFWQTVITVILWFGHSKTVLFCAYNLTLIFGGHAYRMFHDGVLSLSSLCNTSLKESPNNQWAAKLCL